MRQISIKIDRQMQQQTHINKNRKINGQCNHYRFAEELDRHKKR